MTLLRAAAIVLGLVVVASASQPFAQSPTAPSRIFRFATDEFWLNLHHYLYVLGRADAKMRDALREAVAGAPGDSDRGLASLTADERQAWRDAIAFYAAGPSRKDVIFDEPLPTVAIALAGAGDRAQLDRAAIDPQLRSALERAAPIYRKAWWPAHQAANVARRDDIQALVDRHGEAVLAFITRAYAMEWPAGGYPVHLSGYANWAGAYSNTGKHLLVMSGLDRATRGLSGLETAFHESMHQWDGAVNDLLYAQARRTNTRLPPGLSHAMIFFTAGEAVRHAAPSHVAYADANGVWERGFQRFKAPLEQAWKPYLDGHGTRDEALAAVIERTGIARREHR